MFTKDELLRCMDIVADINHDMTPRQAFLTYSGHVEMVSINIYPDGWKPNGEGGETSFHGWKSASGDYFVKDVADGIVLNDKEKTVYNSLTDMLVAVKVCGKERL